MIIFLSIVFILIVTVIIILQQATFGGNSKGTRLERNLQSPNYKNGRFQNISYTPALAKNASYFKLLKLQFSPIPDRTPAEIIPAIKTDLTNLTKNEDAIIWFGHSSYFIQLEGKNILVDPVFSQRASPFQFLGSKSYMGTMLYSAKDFPDIDYLIITHDHYDHMDYNTISELKSKVGRVITPLGVGSHLERWGIVADKITELDWWDSVGVSETIKFTATPGRHFSGRTLTRNKTLWASFVLESSTYKIFIGGDSGYDTHFKTIGEKFGPFDLAILYQSEIIFSPIFVALIFLFIFGL